MDTFCKCLDSTVSSCQHEANDEDEDLGLYVWYCPLNSRDFLDRLHTYLLYYYREKLNAQEHVDNLFKQAFRCFKSLTFQTLSPLIIYRVLLCCFIYVNKLYTDKTIPHSYWASIGCMSGELLSKIETDFICRRISYSHFDL